MVLAGGAIALAVVLAYANSLAGPFVLDDIESITNNPSIRSLAAPGRILSPSGRLTIGGRPVVNASLAVNYAVSKLDVRSYHLVNLLIHLAAAWLLLAVVRRTLVLPRLSFSQAEATWLATAIALIWAVHPLQTSAVTYVIQRAESLMALLYLLTLTCVIRSASGRPRLWGALAVVACAAGMATKEVMVTAPVIVLLYDRTFLAGSWRAALRRRWLLYAAMAATWAVVLVLLSPRHGQINPLRYAATQPGVVLHYLRLTVWPDPLVFYYAWPLARTAGDIVGPSILIAALLAATVWALWRRPVWGFLAASFFVILAPTSTLVPIDDPIFEHRMYLPLASLVAMAVCAAWAGWRRLRRGTQPGGGAMAYAPAAVAMLLVVALGVRTHLRNRDYRSDIGLWRQVAEQQPGNAKAFNNLGLALVTGGQAREGIAAYDRAIEVMPTLARAYVNRALAYKELHRYRRALLDVERAMTIKKDYAAAYHVRGDILSARGHLRAALIDYKQAVSLGPGHIDSSFALALCYFELDQYRQAIKACTDTLRLAPDHLESRLVRGLSLQQISLYDRAEADFSRAARLAPNDPRAFGWRAVLRHQQKQYDLARADLDRCQALGGQAPEGLVAALARAGQ